MAQAFGSAELEAVVPRLRRYARALTASREAADDLTQDTLERAWQKRTLWRAGTDLRAWMFTIMHNVFVNGTRKARVTVPLDEVGEDARPAFGASVETGIVIGELADVGLHVEQVVGEELEDFLAGGEDDRRRALFDLLSLRLSFR